MPKFRFRLATLQKLRAAVRDERRAQWLEAQAAQAEWAARLTELQRRHAQLREDRTIAAGPVDVDRVIATQRYETIVLLEIAQTQQGLNLAATETERRRQALQLAERDLRVLEKLEERQRAEHRAEEERRLQATLDEVALLRRAQEAEAC